MKINQTYEILTNAKEDEAINIVLTLLKTTEDGTTGDCSDTASIARVALEEFIEYLSNFERY